MNNIVLQIILTVCMLIVTAIAGLIPLKVVKMLANKEKGKGAKWLSFLSCFSGGVFMATCFLDIIPHINEIFAEYQSRSGNDIHFPIPQLFICLGFFLVYLIEEFCLKVFSSHGHSHGHSHGNGGHVEAAVATPTVKEAANANLRSEHPLLKKTDDPDERSRSMHSSLSSTLTLVMEETANYAVADAKDSSLLKSITFAIAISFHSVLEGFAMGVQQTLANIMALFLSLLIHKAIEAFSVGLQVCKGNSDKLKAVIITIVIYSLMTPLGSTLGIILQVSNIDPATKDGVVLILESMAAGTFIYVTFLEVLAPEKDNEHNSLLQLGAIFLGFALITLLQFVFDHHESHGNSEVLDTTTIIPRL